MNARHLIHIREALWKRPERGACVMVGAGLSMQAGAGHVGETRPPSWKKLAHLLQERLRCGKPGSGPSPRAESVTAGDCSGLAQQFKATFGQSALDSFLLASVPDGEPGSVHDRLLRLPWADVFTTNWDTLLEKASRRVFERTYDPVLGSADLATTVAPRIVKLHGSFPSNRPFVVTEEDYRTYPTRFAPLVNTVQQALMESVFLLVGFSGDDPNFLHWCGWVRDHLGPAAPRLYLAGRLDLDPPKRLVLEERGVIPIDLAPEVAGAPSREAAHREANEWILSSLEAGETREERWPVPPPPRPGSDAAGIALPVPASDQPHRTPEAPSQDSDMEALAEQVKKVSAVWRHNRNVYPGWPILPFSKHRQLSADTQTWVEPMLKAIPALSPMDRLTVMREWIERTELLMDRLTPELAQAVTDALSAIDEYLSASSDLSDERRNEIQEDRAVLMLALLTDSRHDLDQASFDDWERRLEGIVRPLTPAFHRLHHERCLWKLQEQDFADLGERLDAWDAGDSDPMWSLRKAALLVEAGEVDDGRRQALGAIQRAERAWSRDRRVLTAGRLGWALQWRHVLNLAEWCETWQAKRAWRPDTDLWARLAPHDADTRSDLDAYVRQMTKEPIDESPWTFDLSRVRRFRVFSSEYRSFHIAWRVVRLLELSGLPSGLPGVRVLSDHTDRAARRLARYVPAHAARLLLVGGTGNDEALDAVVSQTHLARMSGEEAAALFDAAQRARDHFLGRWTPDGEAADFYRERAQKAIEIMSRCVARYGAAAASDTFGWAIRYARPRGWVDNPFWSSVAKLWQRSWGAMALESRASAAPEILQASIPEDAFITDSDPGDLLLSQHPRIKRADVEEPIWASCVHQICTALRGSDVTRRLAIGRLNALARKHLLSEAEEQKVAGSLWGSVYQDSTGLPQIRRVDDWLYLLLPEPRPGLAERHFRTKWIGPDAAQASAERRESTIRNVAAAWNPEHVGERAIRLTEDEEKWFWRLVEEWLRREARQHLVLGTSRDHAVPLLVDLITHRRAPTSVLDGLAENADPVPGRRMPTAEQWGSPQNEYLMIAAAAALGGSDAGDAEHRVRLATRSPDDGVSLAAWNAVRWWIRQSARTGGLPMHPLSVESVGDIGVSVGTTQQSGLVGALRAAYAVYQSRNPEFIEAIHPRIIQGLGQLRSELDYQTNTMDRRAAEELPLRRHWCVWLALAIADANRGDDEAVRFWIEAGDNDPLCLVRFVREWHVASRSGVDTDENG